MAESTSRPVKTSRTHPLPIAIVATPGGGSIGMTLCPGKRQPEAITGPWERGLADDFAVITQFAARHLVTLMETHELLAAQVPPETLAAAARASDMTWHHWPIADFTTPDEAFERLWRAEARALRDTLADGRRVLVHCRGGRGRSGLVAARFLIELGMAAPDAISAVRAAQPMAMETTAQEHHVRGYKPIL
jgi:ADP-ribosyl-[dinitrogen reductase] hydrolase